MIYLMDTTGAVTHEKGHRATACDRHVSPVADIDWHFFEMIVRIHQDSPSSAFQCSALVIPDDSAKFAKCRAIKEYSNSSHD